MFANYKAGFYIKLKLFEFMRRLFVLIAIATIIAPFTDAQLVLNYNPNQQPTDKIQYFKPIEEDLFVGDCIPFSHNGVFYLYWLIDKGHHSSLNGLGGHQWALSTSTDLINLKHYPIALGLDEEWGKSICTGSVIYAEKSFYAFYSTRLIKGWENAGAVKLCNEQ